MRQQTNLPTGWCLAEFSEAFDPVSDQGRQIAQSEYLPEGPLPVVDQGEALIGGYTAETAAQVKGNLPLIIFGDHTRRVKYVDFPFAVGAQGVKLLRPTDAFSPKFLFYLLPSLELPDRGYSRHYQFLRNVPFVMPPRPEQKRIVNQLETLFTEIDAAVAALRRVQANLKRYRASVLKAACEGRLVATEAELARKEGRTYETGEQLLARILKERRTKWETDQLAKMLAAGKPPQNDGWKKKYKEPADPDITSLPDLPEGWTWASLEQLTSMITSGSRGWAEHYAKSGPLFIRAQDINKDYLELAEVAHVSLPPNSEGTRTRVFRLDLLVTITGANVTKTALVRTELPEAYVSQHVALVRPVFRKIAAYLYLWVVSPPNGRKVLEVAAYGAGKPGLNLDNLRELLVAIPPACEQDRIVDAVEQYFGGVDVVSAAATTSLQRSDRLRQAILKRAFEGKLVPQDPNDEPASVLLERIRTERAQRNSTKPKPPRFRRKAESASA